MGVALPDPPTRFTPTHNQNGRQLCSHCGSPAEPHPIRVGDLLFCCNGCRFVHQWIRSEGLEKFYDLREGPQTPVPSAIFHNQNWAWLNPLMCAQSGTFELDVQGMSCLACVWLIQRLFEKHPGAHSLELDLLQGTARLHVHPDTFPVQDFARQLHQLGYRLGPPDSKPSHPESRGLRLRLGVCAALALNAMLFSVPGYCGLDPADPLAVFFAKGSLVCATLSMAIGATYFIQRALQGLRQRIIHTDLPIALGLLAAYLGSIHAWTKGHQAGFYFDFVSIFTFLMLVGRWTHQRSLELNRQRLLQTPVSVHTPACSEQYRLEPGMVVPVRSRLLSETASFGMEWINGESQTRSALQGGLLPSGAVLLGSKPVTLEALEAWESSLLASLIAPPRRHPQNDTATQRFILAYLVAVLAIACLGLAVWLTRGAALPQALQVFISVLVVSCPCASGVALPLLQEVATARMRDSGVFIRESSLWSRLLRVSRIVFDKTGTLTADCLQLTDEASLCLLSPEALQALRTLVCDSLHPVATSLREALAQTALPPSPSHGVQEVTGCGLEFQDSHQALWRLGKATWAAASNPDLAQNGTVLSRSGTPIATFHFSERLRPDAPEEIAALQRQGLDIQILSGDHPDRVHAMASQLGLQSQALGAQSPADKASWLLSHQGAQNSLMLGDGANDSPAFAEALCCGTPAVDRGVLEQRADFYYLGRGLEGIRRLWEMARFKRRVVLQILTFTTLYNAGAIGLSLAGRMHPLLAAVLMPASSLATLAIVWIAFRRKNTATISHPHEVP
jgi:Cu2+-exporting ATPase